MCCFVAPMAEAIITTIATIVLEHSAKSESESRALENATHTDHSASHLAQIAKDVKLLSRMLWLVTGVLIIDHAMNGELMLAYPFFTAATSPDGISTMMHEIATIGVAMSVFITGVWAAMLIARKVRKQANANDVA